MNTKKILGIALGIGALLYFLNKKKVAAKPAAISPAVAAKIGNSTTPPDNAVNSRTTPGFHPASTGSGGGSAGGGGGLSANAGKIWDGLKNLFGGSDTKSPDATDANGDGVPDDQESLDTSGNAPGDGLDTSGGGDFTGTDFSTGTTEDGLSGGAVDSGGEEQRLRRHRHAQADAAARARIQKRFARN